MTPSIDDWHDWLRILNFLVSTICIFFLARRFTQNSHDWNTKTRDYWFALTMWCVAGMALSIEGVYRDSPAGARLVFILIALLVSLKGLSRSGDWGGHDR